MQYPLKNAVLVENGGFGVDPATYKPFGLVGHHGIDLVAAVGTPVYAPESGIITISMNGAIDQYTGSNVAGETMVMHGKYEHWLLHLSKRLVSVGQRVEEGQLIGYSGATGFVTGPHLHWGVRLLKPKIDNGYRGFVNPLTVLEEDMYEGKTAQEWAAIAREANSFKQALINSDAWEGDMNARIEKVTPVLNDLQRFKHDALRSAQEASEDAELGRKVRELVKE